MRRRLAEDGTITFTRGQRRFLVRVFRWVSGKGKSAAIWSPAERNEIRKAMGK